MNKTLKNIALALLLLLGSTAYGWLFAIFSKGNMPDYKALIGILVLTVPATGVGLFFARKALSASFRDQQLNSVAVVVFSILNIGVLLGCFMNFWFPLKSGINSEYEAGRAVIERASISDKEKKELDSFLLRRLLEKHF